MGRESMNLTEEQWAEIQRRQGFVNFEPHPPLPTSAQSKKKPRGPNSWERAYALELEARKQAGEILWYGFEKITLKLAHDCRFTPDFAVMVQQKDATGAWREWLQLHEVKGHLRDDARDKFVIAAEMFSWAEFLMYRKRKGGGWDLIKHLNGRP